MLPKIQFTRSWIYDEHLVRKEIGKRPSEKFLISQIIKVEKLWRKREKAILTEISKAVGLPWNEKQINIYATWGSGWFSKPLTLSMQKEPEWLFHTMTHELIHRIWSENNNWDKISPRWDKLMDKYKKETINTRIHIPVHAVHKHIFLKFFGQKTLAKEIADMKKYKDYSRSWKIVERDGYKDIIRVLNSKFK